MLTRFMSTVAIGLAMTLAGGAPVRAQSAGSPLPQAIIGGANVKFARIAVYYDFSGGGEIVRSKGVARVTHPATGVYCVRPDFTINTQRVIASVTVARFLTGGVIAHWWAPATSCPNARRWIEVRTYGYSTVSDSWVPANAVAWSLVVP